MGHLQESYSKMLGILVEEVGDYGWRVSLGQCVFSAEGRFGLFLKIGKKFNPFSFC